MKLEINDPSSVDHKDQPWPTAVLEILPTQIMEFVPLTEQTDGTLRQSKDGFIMAKIGSYQSVERHREAWTIEIATIEELIQDFVIKGGFDITITKSKVSGCAGLLEFEEPPSYASSYS